jgi:hypothetical protein
MTQPTDSGDDATMPPDGLDLPSLAALVVMGLVALNQFRLTRENRRKVIAEGSRDAAQGSDFISQGADRMLKHWEDDNRRLRERVEVLESNEERLEDRLRACLRRVDALESLLRAHGIDIPVSD